MNTLTLNESIEKIEQAAIRINNDVTTMPRPFRHNDIVKFLIRKGFDLLTMEFGFVTSTDRYVNRIEAKEIALHAGQIKNINILNLTSEDLW